MFAWKTNFYKPLQWRNEGLWKFNPNYKYLNVFWTWPGCKGRGWRGWAYSFFLNDFWIWEILVRLNGSKKCEIISNKVKIPIFSEKLQNRTAAGVVYCALKIFSAINLSCTSLLSASPKPEYFSNKNFNFLFKPPPLSKILVARLGFCQIVVTLQYFDYISNFNDLQSSRALSK